MPEVGGFCQRRRRHQNCSHCRRQTKIASMHNDAAQGLYVSGSNSFGCRWLGQKPQLKVEAQHLCGSASQNMRIFSDLTLSVSKSFSPRIYSACTITNKCLTAVNFSQKSTLKPIVTRDALHQMLKTDRANCKQLLSLKRPENKVNKEEQVDEPITFSMLTPRGRNASSKVRYTLVRQTAAQ